MRAQEGGGWGLGHWICWFACENHWIGWLHAQRQIICHLQQLINPGGSVSPGTARPQVLKHHNIMGYPEWSHKIENMLQRGLSFPVAKVELPQWRKIHIVGQLVAR